MKLYILKAKNKNEIEDIQSKLAKNKFKVQASEDHYVLMKRRRYGNTVIQLGVLFFALFITYPLLIVNVAYFTYSYLFRSPNVLVTTETKDIDGNDLEYNSLDEVLEVANAIL